MIYSKRVPPALQPELQQSCCYFKKHSTVHYTLVVLFLLLGSPVWSAVIAPSQVSRWLPLQIDVVEASLATTESADDLNPFLDIALNVTFTSPQGQQYLVPGFYAGDGQGNGRGAVWSVRFSADTTGEWQYRVSFITGNNIAVDNLALSKSLPGDGEQGSFQVVTEADDASGFLAHGRLQYVGEHYLRFADGTYWIKGGVDSPENLFGFAGFDGTVDQPGGVAADGLTDGLHRYEAHVNDWREGDPDFSNSESGVSGRGLIGAINYLASEGINSMYFLPMNLKGDGRDTFPFVAASGSHFDNTHYDISKLHQWNQVLSHMQKQGIAAHIVLGEQEIGNTNWLDDGELGVERKLFYRELVARFSYLMAIKWNLSEESRFNASQHRQFAGFLRQLDWAQHPISVHTRRDLPEERYADLLGSSLFEATSIQFSAENAGRFVEDWRTNSLDAGRRWIIDMDEVGPATVGLTDSNANELRREVLYPVYFSGGQLEWYFGYHDLPLGGDIRTEDFRTRETMYRYMKIAREFLQNLPFNEMEPADELFTAASDQSVEVFAKPGEVYAIYLPIETVSGVINVPDGTYRETWFNPRLGVYGDAVDRQSDSGIVIDVKGSDADGSAESDQSGSDWVVLLQNLQSSVSAVAAVAAVETGSPSSTVSPEPIENIVVEEAQTAAATASEMEMEMESTLPEVGAALPGTENPGPSPVTETLQAEEVTGLLPVTDSDTDPDTTEAVTAGGGTNPDMGEALPTLAVASWSWMGLMMLLALWLTGFRRDAGANAPSGRQLPKRLVSVLRPSNIT